MVIKSVRELLSDYLESREEPVSAERINFGGVNGKDVYNITAPFDMDGESIIAGRVEDRDSEDSEIVFFRNENGHWVPKEDAVRSRLQDPFFTFIDGEFITGGVQTYLKPDNHLGWRTVLYRGHSLSDLKLFFKGPDGMKDLRIVQLIDGRIGVFTRPQGDKGGRGKIGYTSVDNLEQLSIEVVNDAPLIPERFAENEWGGCNEAHLLKDGTIGILGHIASFDDPHDVSSDRHYYSMTFIMDPSTGSCTDVKLLAIRDDFLPCEAKIPSLHDVIFSGGLVRHDDGTATLYTGVGDADAQCLKVRDPFAGL